MKMHKRGDWGIMRSVIVIVAALLALAPAVAISGAGTARAGSEMKLVMFSSKGCGHCIRFRREVMPRYHLSRLARKAPLREVGVGGSAASRYPLRRAVAFTPTFVLFRRGREAGRMVGYTNRKSFYRQLAKMVRRAERRK
jgi:thioredoxin-related protein